MKKSALKEQNCLVSLVRENKKQKKVCNGQLFLYYKNVGIVMQFAIIKQHKARTCVCVWREEHTAVIKLQDQIARCFFADSDKSILQGTQNCTAEFRFMFTIVHFSCFINRKAHVAADLNSDKQ